MNAFGKKIRELREDAGKPLRKVAAFVDVDQAILSKIERGQRKASREQVLRFAEYFKVEERDLLVLWLSDKMLYEIGDEKLGLEALQVAENQLEYIIFNKIDRKKLVSDIKRILKKFNMIKKGWIFGSFSRKDDNPKSDIDILVDVPTDQEFTFFDLAEIKELIEEKINRKADVVLLSAIKPQVKERIKDDLKLIYEAR